MTTLAPRSNAPRHATPSIDEMAVAVLFDRINRLSVDDRRDLFEVIPELAAEDEDERMSAERTVLEILRGASTCVAAVELDDSPNGERTNWMTFFADRLKQARHEAGLTQLELSAASGIPQSHISRLEHAQHSASAKTVEKLAKALNKPVSWFDPSNV